MSNDENASVHGWVITRRLRLHGGRQADVPDRVWGEWVRANEAAWGVPIGEPCDECAKAGISVLVCTAVGQIDAEALSPHYVAAMAAPVQGGSTALDRWVSACEQLRLHALDEVLAA